MGKLTKSSSYPQLSFLDPIVGENRGSRKKHPDAATVTLERRTGASAQTVAGADITYTMVELLQA